MTAAEAAPLISLLGYSMRVMQKVLKYLVFFVLMAFGYSMIVVQKVLPYFIFFFPCGLCRKRSVLCTFSQGCLQAQTLYLI